MTKMFLITDDTGVSEVNGQGKIYIQSGCIECNANSAYIICIFKAMFAWGVKLTRMVLNSRFFSSKAVVILSLTRCFCFFHCVVAGIVSLVLLCGCIMPFFVKWASYAMRTCFLDFGCAIVVVNVFVVLLCRDLTTAESRVKVWRPINAF